jgi:hypothetical protein
MLAPSCKSAKFDRYFERISDLTVFPFGQLFLPFSLQTLYFAAVAVRRPICQKRLRFSSPRTKSQSLNQALISEKNLFRPVLLSLSVLGMELTVAL